MFLGVMEFDSAIMDYRRRYGAVMSLRDVKTPISVARSIMGKYVTELMIDCCCCCCCCCCCYHYD